MDILFVTKPVSATKFLRHAVRSGSSQTKKACSLDMIDQAWVIGGEVHLQTSMKYEASSLISRIRFFFLITQILF